MWTRTSGEAVEHSRSPLATVLGTQQVRGEGTGRPSGSGRSQNARGPGDARKARPAGWTVQETKGQAERQQYLVKEMGPP